MFVAKSVKTEHKDLIHDVSFDYYGTRMATCSSDQTVKVWDEGEDGTWRCTASWRTHSGSVWRVTWAHPEFGQVLATCSFDRTAAVWEELSSNASIKPGNSTTTWLKKAMLVDSRTSVTDVKFAPRHYGLLLATCSADGVRIYVAVDVMNLSNWQVQYDFSCNLNLSCLSWSSSRLHPQTIAVGSDDPNPSAGGKVHLYEYSEAARKWQKVETLYAITEPVHDIRFAPNLGRSFDLLAVASRDLNVFSLKRTSSESGNNPSSASKFEMRQVGIFDDHESLVWRVSWNVTGTILASSGDDGCVRIWKANYLDKWKCISVLKGDSNASEAERAAMFANSMSSTPTPSHFRPNQLPGAPGDGKTVWPYSELDVDQSKIYY